jgi:hypothetical protein
MVGGVAAVAHHAGAASAQAEDAQEQQAAEQVAPAAPIAPGPLAAAPTEDPIEKLTELKGLLDSGVLTQAEFDAQKQKILAAGI